MLRKGTWKLLLGVSLVASTAVSVQVLADKDMDKDTSSESMTPETKKGGDTDMASIAEDAYVYGYPLVLMDQTMKQTTNVATAGNETAPVNQFARVKELPNADFKAIVRPNVDTLYTSAFLDLSQEPIVLHVPATKGRYYLMPMLDAYTNVFASPGKRTTGTKELNVAIVGPDWKGKLPKGVKKIEAPTNLVWLLGRTEIKGKEDMPEVTALIEKYTLTPLSAYGKPYTPATNDNVDKSLPGMDVKPPDVVAKMDDKAYFERLAMLLKQYPPPAKDRAALERFAKIGLMPGRFAPSAAATTAMEGTGRRALPKIAENMQTMGKEMNNWRVDMNLGTYGTRYLDRATVALEGLGANLAKDAVYPSAMKDGKGEMLTGANPYVLHFAKGKEPPVKAFWSLTMYDQDGYLIANPIDRYAIGDRDKMVKNKDGSLDILIQNEEPKGAMSANWLPAPKGEFNLMLRMYWPEEKILNGKWAPPPVMEKGETKLGGAKSPRE